MGYTSAGATFGTGNLYVSGNVGVGTTAPTGKLQVDQNYNLSPSLALNQPIAAWGTFALFQSYRYLQTTSAATDGNFKQFNLGAGGLAIGYSTTPAYGSGDGLYVNGNVGIGTTNPQSLLAVNGTITTKEVVVTSANWSDYVFGPDYRLAPLGEVSDYIRANHHLPDIPSAKEVDEKGISVGAMQAKLLAKIEELTLHMIEQEEQIRELKEKVAGSEGQRPGEGKSREQNK